MDALTLRSELPRIAHVLRKNEGVAVFEDALERLLDLGIGVTFSRFANTHVSVSCEDYGSFAVSDAYPAAVLLARACSELVQRIEDSEHRTRV